MGAAIYTIPGRTSPLRHVRRRPSKARILVVDDEESMLQLMQDILDDASFEVLAASEGHVALKLAMQSRPDLIITDLMMPGMDGRILRERLKLEPRTASIPVIVMSAVYHPQPGDEFADVIHKPFDIDELLHHVQRHISPQVSPLPA